MARFKNIDEIPGLDLKSIHQIIASVIHTRKTINIQYDYERQKRAAVCSYLEKKIFGTEALAFVSQNVTEVYRLKEKVEATLDSLQYAARLSNICSFHGDSNGIISADSFYENREPNWGCVNGKAISPDKWVYFEDLKKFKEEWEALVQNKIKELHLSYRSNYYGSIRYYSMIATVSAPHILKKAKELKGKTGSPTPLIFGVIQDITILGENERKLKEAMIAAQSADRAKSYFIAIMSHELRTPLNAVIGFSDLLQLDGTSQEESINYIKSINSAGKNLLSLIDDLLDLSKLEADWIKIVLKKTRISDLISDVHNLSDQKAKVKNLQFIDYCPSHLPYFYLDNLRLRQVMFNLVGNAIKFTNKGSVVLSIDFILDKEPTSQTKKGELIFSISDTGIGIKKDFIDHVFEPFAQQEQSGTRGSRLYEGSGLGLTISERLVKRMGGEVIVESEEGAGSTFLVKLKNVQYEYDDDPTNMQEAKDVDISIGRDRMALLVDDVPTNLHVLDAMLKRLGFNIVLASSAKEALSLLKEQIPSIALLDLWMPGMTGAELASNMRQQSDLASMKIIAVTADVEAKDDFNLEAFDAIMYKPVEFEKLRKLLSEQLP